MKELKSKVEELETVRHTEALEQQRQSLLTYRQNFDGTVETGQSEQQQRHGQHCPQATGTQEDLGRPHLSSRAAWHSASLAAPP